MSELQYLQDSLCNTFCSSISVNPVSSGLAVSTLFSDRSGDRLGFYVIEDDDSFHIEDDGDYLATMVATGFPIDTGRRAKLLDAVLEGVDAYWDRDTYEIKSAHFSKDELGKRLIGFLSALIRVRDIEYLALETVRSTFREDAISALKERFEGKADFDENDAIDADLSDYPADLVIRPRDPTALKGAMFFATTNDKLNEALLCQIEIEQRERTDCRVLALVEDSEMRLISKRRFQRAQNRSLTMPIFRGDEKAAIMRIGKDLRL